MFRNNQESYRLYIYGRDSRHNNSRSVSDAAVTHIRHRRTRRVIANCIITAAETIIYYLMYYYYYYYFFLYQH